MKELSEANYKALTPEQREVVDSYVIKGPTIRQVGEEIDSHLDGILDAICFEVVDESSVGVFLVKRGDDTLTLKPFLQWEQGKVTLCSPRSEGTDVEFVKPPHKGQGVFFAPVGERVFIGMR